MSNRSPDQTDIFVGKRIRIARVMANKSQTELGDAIGVTFQQIQKYENGVNRCGPSRLQKIGEFVGKPVSYFFDEHTDERTRKQVADQDIITTMLTTPYGVELARSYIAISNQQRRVVADVARTIAERAA